MHIILGLVNYRLARPAGLPGRVIEVVLPPPPPPPIFQRSRVISRQVAEKFGHDARENLIIASAATARTTLASSGEHPVKCGCGHDGIALYAADAHITKTRFGVARRTKLCCVLSVRSKTYRNCGRAVGRWMFGGQHRYIYIYEYSRNIEDEDGAGKNACRTYTYTILNN